MHRFSIHCVGCVRSLGELTEDMTDAEPSDAPRSLVNGRLDPRPLVMVVAFVYQRAGQAPHLFLLPSGQGKPVTMPTFVSWLLCHWLWLFT